MGPISGSLYGVNTETRALIKRSSRAGDLKKRSRVREMSSISTLEFAWENKSWWSGYLWNETSFCLQVAKTNKLELLKWAREEKKCKWDLRTATWAHQNGHLHILEYLIESKFDKYDEVACQFAAGNGLLDFLKYLARNRQSRVELFGRTRRALQQTTRMFTIPPRQQLSNCTRLAIRTRNVIRLGGRRNLLALFYVFCSPFDGFFSNFTPFSTKRKSRHTYAQKGARDVVAKSISRENESVDVSRVQHVVFL